MNEQKENRYLGLVNRSHDLIFEIDSARAFLFVNETWFREFGYTHEEVASLKFEDTIAPVNLSFLRLMVRRVWKGERYENIQAVFLTKDKRELTVLGDMIPHTSADGTISVQCLFRNISKQKTAERALRDSNQKLQNLSRRLLHIQEEERRKLSRELHDEIGQRMTVMKMQLQTVNRRNQQENLTAQLTDTIELISMTLQDIRSLSMDLRPTLLDDMGLASTLRWYLDKQSQRTGIQMQLQSNFQGKLPADIKIICFRIIQEAITNALRHAEATLIEVIVDASSKGTSVKIIDNGLGFDVDQVKEQSNRGSSLGLRGMEERLMLANGRIQIESAKGKGTTIEAWIPTQSFQIG